MAEHPIDHHARLEAGNVRISRTDAGNWLVSWYPDQGEPDYPGFTLDSSTRPDIPVEGGVEGILSWVKQQAWTRRRSI